MKKKTLLYSLKNTSTLTIQNGTTYHFKLQKPALKVWQSLHAQALTESEICNSNTSERDSDKRQKVKESVRSVLPVVRHKTPRLPYITCMNPIKPSVFH